MIKISTTRNPDMKSYYATLSINVNIFQEDMDVFFKKWDELSFTVWCDLLNKSLVQLSRKEQKKVTTQFLYQLSYERWKEEVLNLLIQGKPLEITIIRSENNILSVETKLDGKIIANPLSP